MDETKGVLKFSGHKNEVLKEVVRQLNFPEDTIVLFGDCDEFPRREVVEAIRNEEIKTDNQTLVNLQMNLYYFYFNWTLEEDVSS